MKTLNLTLVNDATQATVVTHPAPHHGDETTAIAIIALVEGRANVYRTRNPKAIEEAVAAGSAIVDVGGVYDPEAARFDHHQRDFAETREDGTKYSSAGLLWKEYGVDACIELTGCNLEQAESAAVKVDEMLIKGIDAIDNGQAITNTDGVMSVSQAISVLNPNWDEPTTDESFLDACQLAYAISTRTVLSCVAVVKGQDAVEESVRTAEDHVMILPQFIGGWIQTTVGSANPKAGDLLYGVFKNLQGQWNVQALPPVGEPTAQRKPLQEAWRGLNGAALQEITGVEDAVFCHAGGFICGAKSQEGALALARLAVNA